MTKELEELEQLSDEIKHRKIKELSREDWEQIKEETSGQVRGIADQIITISDLSGKPPRAYFEFLTGNYDGGHNYCPNCGEEL